MSRQQSRTECRPLNVYTAQRRVAEGRIAPTLSSLLSSLFSLSLLSSLFSLLSSLFSLLSSLFSLLSPLSLSSSLFSLSILSSLSSLSSPLSLSSLLSSLFSLLSFLSLFSLLSSLFSLSLFSLLSSLSPLSSQTYWLGDCRRNLPIFKSKSHAYCLLSHMGHVMSQTIMETFTSRLVLYDCVLSFNNISRDNLHNLRGKKETPAAGYFVWYLN